MLRSPQHSQKAMKTLVFGDVTVTRVVESEGPGFYPGFFFPDFDQDALDAEANWLEPHHYHRESGRMVMSLHTYVVQTPELTILIDTCVGNDKERPSTKPWHRMQTPWLARLADIGVKPESVDVVLCTHLHVDHVGWNTRLSDGRWVPTFPNARYLFERQEYKYWSSADEIGDGRAAGSDGCFEDSVLPVMESGQAELVDGDHEIAKGLWLEPSPGHSPGHVCMNLQKGDDRAIFSGDLMHHPIQCAYPSWNSRFCYDPVQSRSSRETFVDRHADTDMIVLAAHFAAPTAGRIISNGDRCRFDFMEDH